IDKTTWTHRSDSKFPRLCLPNRLDDDISPTSALSLGPYSITLLLQRKPTDIKHTICTKTLSQRQTLTSAPRQGNACPAQFRHRREKQSQWASTKDSYGSIARNRTGVNAMQSTSEWFCQCCGDI